MKRQAVLAGVVAMLICAGVAAQETGSSRLSPAVYQSNAYSRGGPLQLVSRPLQVLRTSLVGYSGSACGVKGCVQKPCVQKPCVQKPKCCAPKCCAPKCCAPKCVQKPRCCAPKCVQKPHCVQKPICCAPKCCAPKCVQKPKCCAPKGCGGYCHSGGPRGLLAHIFQRNNAYYPEAMPVAPMGNEGDPFVDDPGQMRSATRPRQVR